MSQLQLIPEWAEQDAVLLSWPHEKTDWLPILDRVESCYRTIAIEILRRQKLLLVGNTAQKARLSLPQELQANCYAFPIETNDTWIRDYGPLACIDEENNKVIVDCGFNAWGLKFASNLDNNVLRHLYACGVFAPSVTYQNELNFIFEGGAIETNSRGILLSTDSCILEGNRNPQLTATEIKQKISSLLGGKILLSLCNGAIPGDDTDGHIDTLVRFIDPTTLVYVSPSDPQSTTYGTLLKMELELQQIANEYQLNLTPLPDAGNFIGREGELIPATYANFLFINGAVLLPIYNRPTDIIAMEQLQKALPNREICPIDCSSLIEQHGSLHCISMQIPKGFLSL